MNQASADELTISHFQKPSRPLLPRTGYKPLLSTVTLYGRMLLVFANPFNAWAWWVGLAQTSEFWGLMEVRGLVVGACGVV